VNMGDGSSKSYKEKDLTGKEFENASFKKCDLNRCRLRNCTVEKCDVVNCQVEGGSMETVDIKGNTILQRVTVKMCDLFDCELRNCTITEFDVKGAVKAYGGSLKEGEVKIHQGGSIATDGSTRVSRVDNYRHTPLPSGGSNVPVAHPVGHPPAAGGYPSAGYAQPPPSKHGGPVYGAPPGAAGPPMGHPVAQPVAVPPNMRPAPPNPTGGGVNPYGAQQQAPPRTNAGGTAEIVNPYGADAGSRDHMAGRDIDDSDAPARFQCAITMQVMRCPVMTHSGHNYEFDAIVDWIKKNGVCPQTREPLRADQLHPNRALKEEIDEWVAEKRKQE